MRLEIGVCKWLWVFVNEYISRSVRELLCVFVRSRLCLCLCVCFCIYACARSKILNAKKKVVVHLLNVRNLWSFFNLFVCFPHISCLQNIQVLQSFFKTLGLIFVVWRYRSLKTRCDTHIHAYMHKHIHWGAHWGIQVVCVSLSLYLFHCFSCTIYCFFSFWREPPTQSLATKGTAPNNCQPTYQWTRDWKSVNMSLRLLAFLGYQVPTSKTC